MKFLLILPILGGVIFFGTSIMESDTLTEDEKRERLMTQFEINYNSMMSKCSEDDLSDNELDSCFNAFDEVREFCVTETQYPCGDEKMQQLEEKLSNN